MKQFKFIDLFAGIGGFRVACEMNKGVCVFSSEWEKNAADIYEENFGDRPTGDITKIKSKDIPNHDLLCAGFPCQAFSLAGKQLGFEDVQGTLIFEVARIVRDKRPKAFLLENVTGLLVHDKGKTFDVIKNLFGKTFNGYNVFFPYKDNLNYHLFYTVLNAADFGLAQRRRRIFIVGFDSKVFKNIKFKFPTGQDSSKKLIDVLEKEKDVDKSLYISDRELINICNSARRYVTTRGCLSGTHEVTATLMKESSYPHLFPFKTAKEIRYMFEADNDTEHEKHKQFLLDLHKKTPIRKLSVLEMARLQGYPETYKLTGLKNKSHNTASGLFGNSIAVPVVAEIVKQIIKHF